MKRLSIRKAIAIPLIALLTVGVLIVTVTLSVASTTIIVGLSGDVVQETVQHYAKEFEALANKQLGIVSGVAPIVEDAAAQEAAWVLLIGQFRAVLMNNDSVTAIWTAWEPWAFTTGGAQMGASDYHDGSGRFVPFVYRDRDGNIRSDRLRGYDDPQSGKYYQQVLEDGSSYVSDPYYYELDGEEVFMFSIAVPVLQRGRVIGAVGADIRLDSYIEHMNGVSLLDQGYLVTYSPGGYIATHPNEEYLGRHYRDIFLMEQTAGGTAPEELPVNVFEEFFHRAVSTGRHVYEQVQSPRLSQGVKMSLQAVEIGDTGQSWVVCGIVPESAVYAPAHKLTAIIIAVAGIAVVLLVPLAIVFFLNRMLRELTGLTVLADQIAMGEISAVEVQQVEDTGTKNEISQLTASFMRMVQTIRQQAEAVQRIAGNDLTVEIEPRSEQDALNTSLKQMLDANNRMFSEILQAASTVDNGATTIADSAQLLAQLSQEQSASVQELTSTMHSIAQKSEANQKLAHQAAVHVGGIKDTADRGGTRMSEMLQAVQNINTSSSSIQKVIRVIEDFAFQTNILALNAAVEAARAGQHGRGFAVVADEVRNLAASSSKAASETSALVAETVAHAEEGSRIVQETDRAFSEIMESIGSSYELIAQIPAASQEQSVAIAQVLASLQQISDTIQRNSANAEESANISREMSQQSSALRQLVGSFHLREDVIQKDQEVQRSLHYERQAEYAMPNTRTEGFSLNRSEDKY